MRRAASSTAATGRFPRAGRCRRTPSPASTSRSSCARIPVDGRASHVRLRGARRHGQARTLLFQTSDTTWQAYNQYGGNSLYVGRPGPGPRLQGQLQPALHHARPRTTEDCVFNAEYPLLRWLERNGYDVSYTTGVDTDRRGAELLEHDVFLSVGHDEYWSAGQRANVEAARDGGRRPRLLLRQRGVLEDALGAVASTAPDQSHRTLVSYKETHAGREDRPDARVDRHLARSALQPARRRRPAGERAHRARSSR